MFPNFAKYQQLELSADLLKKKIIYKEKTLYEWFKDSKYCQFKDSKYCRF